MALLLRKVNWNHWLDSRKPTWLPDGDVPADTCGDLRTRDNGLSLYRLKDDQSDRDRILAALAGSSDSFSNVDFAVFDDSIVDASGIRRDEVPGDTADEYVNAAHIDLVDMNGDHLAALAKGIYVGKKAVDRTGEGQIKKLILAGVKAGQLDFKKLNPKLQPKVQALMQ